MKRLGYAVYLLALILAFDPRMARVWVDPDQVQQVFFNLIKNAEQAMIELVVPLAITVVVVQNGQGIAVLRAAGHQPPIGAATVACGVFSLVNAAVGCVSTCLTGPTNALLTASGERTRQYTAGIFCGLLAVVFGLFAQTFVAMMLGTPTAFIVTLGGLAMLKALQGAFVTAFGGKFTFGALIAFLKGVQK